MCCSPWDGVQEASEPCTLRAVCAEQQALFFPLVFWMACFLRGHFSRGGFLTQVGLGNAKQKQSYTGGFIAELLSPFLHLLNQPCWCVISIYLALIFQKDPWQGF